MGEEGRGDKRGSDGVGRKDMKVHTEGNGELLRRRDEGEFEFGELVELDLFGGGVGE